MTALDTNVIVRFLVRDDEKQTQTVCALFKEGGEKGERFYVSLLVILETIWVLQNVYNRKRDEILNAIEGLMHVLVLEFEASDVLQNFLSSGKESSTHLPDLLIALSAQASGCTSGVTFDKKASRMAFFRLLEPAAYEA